MPSFVDEISESPTSNSHTACKDGAACYVDGVVLSLVMLSRLPTRPKVLQTTKPADVHLLNPALGTGTFSKIPKGSY